LNTNIRILVVDDHAIVRDGINLIMETIDEIEVIGEAANGIEALELLESISPDVILMDLRMPKMDGLSAIESILKTYPEIAIVILTTYNEDELLFQGLKLGAKGFLLKDVDRETLIRTIKAAHQGEALLQPEVLQRLMNQTVEKAPIIKSDLTSREIEVLTGIATGERNKEVAYRLGISERTVKAHLSNIFSKLDVDSRAGAVAVAVTNKLVEL